MLIYRIDYEIDSKGPRVGFCATKLEVDIVKRSIGTALTSFKHEKVDVPTGRYELAAWLNRTFGGSKAAEKASAK